MDAALQHETVIEVRDLGKTFGRGNRAVPALNGVSLTVRRGEVFGLLGRNGAGKTTLVKTLLGLLQPSSGGVRVFGADPSRVAVRRRIGFSPEEPNFPKYLYPRQILELCGALSGMAAGACSLATERELQRAELQQVAGRQARSLSKGMTQRLSIAQAFLHSPDLLILDEPTADLDPIGRRQVRDMIAGFCAAGGTVLVNSHLLSEVERLCHRVAILHQGRICREGRLDQLLAGDRGLEDVFIEVIAAAGGGAGFAGGPPAAPPSLAGLP